MLQSTSIPTQIVIPPNDIMLILISKRFIKSRVINSDTGIAIIIIIESLILLINITSTINAIIEPIIADDTTFEIALLIYSELSFRTSKVILDLYLLLSSLTSWLALVHTSTVFLPDSCPC